MVPISFTVPKNEQSEREQFRLGGPLPGMLSRAQSFSLDPNPYPIGYKTRDNIHSTTSPKTTTLAPSQISRYYKYYPETSITLIKVHV